MLEHYGVAHRVRIYLSETDTVNHRPVHQVITSLLQREGCAGVTVVRGVEGFGAHGRVHAANLVDVRSQLPLIIEWIDNPDRVARVLPKLADQVDGLITVEDVRVVRQPARAVRQIPASVRVRDAMTPAERVHVGTPDTPVREIVSLLLREHRNAIPILDGERRVVGIITNQDLVERAGLPLRLELLRELGEPESGPVRNHLSSMNEDITTAASIMTTPVITTGPDVLLADAARTMLDRRLKRLPVVDEEGRLVGIVSRFDVLRTVRDGYDQEELRPAPKQLHPDHAATTVREIMNAGVPTVSPDSLLPSVLDAIMSTRLHRAVVIDANRVPLGMVVDTDLVQRVTPDAETGMFAALMSRLRSGGASGQRLSHHHDGLTAADVMRSRDEIVIVNEQDDLHEVTERSLSMKSKLIVVVDQSGRLTGMVDRADLLAATT